jgi:hypothetical protein
VAERTYVAVVTFTVHPHADEHLQDEQAIHDEIRSWLEGLGARVEDVRVQEKEGFEIR